MTDEHAISFKHFSLFRKAVVTKQTGVLVYITRMGFAGRLPFVEGRFASSVDQTQLKHFFTKPMQQSSWEDKAHPMENSKEPVVVLAALLEPVVWDDVYCKALSDMLCKLPSVQVEPLPVQFEDYRVEICASLLHRQALSSESFTPAHFLSGITNNETLGLRLKVMVLAYVCGFMNARQAKQQQPEKRASGSAMSGIAGRIFQRIKGIGS